MKDLLAIYQVFFSMGAVTFGGGYTMLPILKREIVQKRDWITEEDILDYYALSQGLPGIIAINVSVFIGYRHRGTPGAVAAALGMVSPCILIISTLAFFLSQFQENPQVQSALAGISVCVAALITDAVLGMWKKGVKDPFGVVLCLGLLALTLFSNLSPILLVLSCALLGILAKPKTEEGAP